MKIDPKKLPDFDMMIAGFPCQSFSINGLRKGMQDERGQIIYGLIKIMKAKKLKYFILENVKGLTNHEGGKTLEIILNELDKAGYEVYHKVLNSVNYGVPQMRERIYFVGIKKGLANKNKKFEWPKPIKTPDIKKYLIEDSNVYEFGKDKKTLDTFLKYTKNKYNIGKHTVEKLLEKENLVIDTRQSDLRTYEGCVPTLRTGRHGIMYIKDKKFRRLSGFESLLFQGFPKKIAIKAKGKINDANLLSQAGNAMTVSSIEAVGKSLINYISE